MNCDSPIASQTPASTTLAAQRAGNRPTATARRNRRPRPTIRFDAVELPEPLRVAVERNLTVRDYLAAEQKAKICEALIRLMLQGHSLRLACVMVGVPVGSVAGRAGDLEKYKSHGIVGLFPAARHHHPISNQAHN